jgi:hypothetical protein
MTSLRKKYLDLPQNPNKSAPVVAATPVTAAEPPPPAEPQKPLEELAKPSAADEAANTAIKARIAEMDRAESLGQHQAANQPPRLAAAEPQREQQTAQTVPAHVQDWLNRHPEYLNDVVAQAELNVATMKCVRDGLNWNDNDFIPTIERHLGFGEQQPPAQTKTAPIQENKVNGHAPVSAPTAPRNPTPARQQQRPGPSVSAPPTRTTPSMTTGKPLTSRPALTNEELMLAASLRISPEEYAQQKDKMQRMQQAGIIQNGGR